MKKISTLMLALIIFFSLNNINVYSSEDEDPSSKVIYITFDDGPNNNTIEILKILEEYNAKATFFLLEDNLKYNNSIAKKIILYGHSIGSHGQSHRVNILHRSESSVLYEMENTKNSIRNLTGYDTNLVRIPYGSKPNLTKMQYKSLIDNGYNMWDWNVDSYDSRGNTTVDQIISKTITQIEKYKTPVVLFHDKQITIKALPTILEYINQKGYKTKIISQSEVSRNWWNNELYK